MVSVPKLQRIQPSASLPANDRIKMQAPNNASDILNRTGNITKLGEAGADLYYDIEDNKIQQLSNEAEQKYTAWNTEQLQKLKSYQGDPTDAYAAHDIAAKEKYDEILNERPDLNERVKSHLSANLNKAMGAQDLHTIKQRGAQQETYANTVFESQVKLKKDNLGINAGYIKKDDPGSFLPMDQNISEIKTTIAKRGFVTGIAKKLPDDAKSWNHIYQDEDGKMVKVELSDIAKSKAAKELSEGVSSSINSMIAGGYTEEAQAAYERYKPYIDVKMKAHLDTKFKTAGVKAAAFNEIGKVENKSDTEQMTAIENIKDPAIKSEALKIKDTNDARREHIKNRREKANYEVLGNRVLKKMNSDDPFHGEADLENDPVFKATYDRLSVKGKKSVLEMVKAPKETDPKAEAAIQNAFFGNDPDNNIEGMSPTKFAELTVGLNKADKTKYTNMYNKQNIQTAGEERAIVKRAGSMLQDQLLSDGHIARNKYGKIAGDDEITLINARNKLIDVLDKRGPMNEKELKDFVKEFSAAEIKGKVFNPAVKTPVTKTSNVPPKDVAISPMKKIELKKKFKDQIGHFPKDDEPQWITFLQNNK